MQAKDCPAKKSKSVQLLVADLHRSVEFYRTLGFEIGFFYADFYCRITRGQYIIHLKIIDQPVKDSYKQNANKHLDLVFSVEKIENVYEDMKSRSIAIIETLKDLPYGYGFYIADPDGNIIAFVEENNL